MKRQLGTLSVLLGAACYGLISPLVKRAYEAGHSFAEITFSQYFFASLGYLLLLLWRRRKSVLSLNDFLATFLTGVVGLGGTSLFYYACLKEVPASFGLILLFQFTWIGILIERIVYKKRISTYQAVAVVFILLGTCLSLGITKADFGALSLKGILYGLAAAFSYSIFLIGTSALNPEIDGLFKSGIMVIGTTLVLFFIFAANHPFHHLNPFSQIYIWGIWLGLLGQFLPTLLFNYGAPKIGGAATTLLSSAELPVGVLASVVFLQEKINAVQFGGLILILLGIAVSQKPEGNRGKLKPKLE